MSVRTLESKAPATLERAPFPAEIVQTRLLNTYAAGIDQYSSGEGVSRGEGPTTVALAGILSLSSDSPQLNRHPQLHTQAALWVVGEGKALGNFGPGGYGIDGKWGKHTRQALKRYMKSRGLSDVNLAKQQLLGEARQKLIGLARKQGWQKVESLLQSRQRNPGDIQAYKKIYSTLTADLEYGAKGSEQDFAAGKRDFQEIRNRVIEIHSPRQKYPAAEAALLRRGKRHLIEAAHSEILAQQLPDRIKIYEELLQEMSELAGKDRQSFTEAKRDYFAIAQRMGIPRQVILETLKYYHQCHENKQH